jgi:hypothetical protein
MTSDEITLRNENFALRNENDALRAQLEGDIPKATQWLQHKVWSQRAALDVLNRRVVSQRFVLRTLEEMGRGLTIDEYREARDAVSNEQLRERIAEPAA